MDPKHHRSSQLAIVGPLQLIWRDRQQVQWGGAERHTVTEELRDVPTRYSWVSSPERIPAALLRLRSPAPSRMCCWMRSCVWRAESDAAARASKGRGSAGHGPQWKGPCLVKSRGVLLGLRHTARSGGGAAGDDCGGPSAGGGGGAAPRVHHGRIPCGPRHPRSHSRPESDPLPVPVYSRNMLSLLTSHQAQSHAHHYPAGSTPACVSSSPVAPMLPWNVTKGRPSRPATSALAGSDGTAR